MKLIFALIVALSCSAAQATPILVSNTVVTTNFQTNIVGATFDPQAVQDAISALPPQWQHYATTAVLLLMILGRVGTSAMTSGGVVPILKSVFMGSVHTQDPVPTPTSIVPPATKPAPAPATPTSVTSKP